MRKILKLFGIKIFEVLTDDEAKQDELKHHKPKGFVLDSTPDELAKEKRRKENV